MEKRNKPATQVVILIRFLQEQRDRSTPGSVPRHTWEQHPAQLHPRCHPNVFHWQNRTEMSRCSQRTGLSGCRELALEKPQSSQNKATEKSSQGCFEVVLCGSFWEAKKKLG